MNVINESIVSKILPFIDESHGDTHSSVRLLEWKLDENVLKSGNNYTSQICRLWVHYEMQGVLSSRAFFVKIPINSPTYEIFKTLGSYDEEIIVYTKILPQMYQINGDPNTVDYFTPRLYYSDDNMTIVLEDLSQYGYKCVDRRHQLDFQHCCQALRSLAKLHGLSHVAANKSADILQWMEFRPEKSGDTEANRSVIERVPMYVDSLSDHIKQKYPNQVLTLRNLSWDDVVDDYYIGKKNKADHDDDDFRVFCHGDFWTNNIMFKYDDNGIVENVKVIDFQFSHWDNPALDIIHFSITSIRFEIYQKYFNELLSVYVQTLNEILAKFDYPLYSVERLLGDISKRYHYACFVFSCILPITLQSTEDYDKAEKGSGTSENVPASDVWTKALKRSYKQQLFIDVSTKWFLHFVDKGYLDAKEMEPTGQN